MRITSRKNSRGNLNRSDEHTPRARCILHGIFIARGGGGEGIFRREDLRRALREAAVTSLQESVWTRAGTVGGRGCVGVNFALSYGISYTRAKARRIPLLQYLSSAPREKSTSMREYSSRSRWPHFSFVRVAGFTVHFSGTGIRRPGPRENIIPPTKRRVMLAGCELSFTLWAFDNRPGHWGGLPLARVNGTLAPSEAPGLLSSESALMVPWRIPEDERPERAVSTETVCGEKLLLPSARAGDKQWIISVAVNRESVWNDVYLCSARNDTSNIGLSPGGRILPLLHVHL